MSFTPIKILDVIAGLTQYPLPSETIQAIATRRGCNLTTEATHESLTAPEFLLTEADIYIWLSTAPNVSQGGQSYSFTTEQQNIFREKANAIYKALGEDSNIINQKPIFGYKGNKL